MTEMKVAILLEDLYEELEFWYPFYRMLEAGFNVDVIAPEVKSYTGKNCLPAKAELAVKDAAANDYAAVIIPGGYSPDKMRREPAMVDFVRLMDKSGKLIAAICHAPWMLASAGILKGKTITSFFSIKDDLVHAGAEWVDREVVEDDNLVTSRNPDDLPAFCRTILGKLTREN